MVAITGIGRAQVVVTGNADLLQGDATLAQGVFAKLFPVLLDGNQRAACPLQGGCVRQGTQLLLLEHRDRSWASALGAVNNRHQAALAGVLQRLMGIQ
ncbi:hypothetical protein D3C73_1312700 [compost metagenome]